MLHKEPAERAFNSMFRNSKASALWIDYRVWTGFRPSSKQNSAIRTIPLWQGADDFPWESTLKKVVPLT
jgi:hypothetical protein